MILFLASRDLSNSLTTSAMHLKVFQLFYIAFSCVSCLVAFSLLYAVNENPIYLFKGYQYLCFRMCLSLATLTPAPLTIFLSSILLPLYCFHFVNVGICFVNTICLLNLLNLKHN